MKYHILDRNPTFLRMPDQKGFLHHVLPLVFIVVFAVIGSALYVASHAATPPTNLGAVAGSFVQTEGESWPTNQSPVFIGITVPESVKISKVSWYLGSTLVYTENTALAPGLYQYNWPTTGYLSGTYRWTAKVFDSSGKGHLVNNNKNETYLDMKISSVGEVSGKFVQPENTSWPKTQSTGYIGIDVSDPSLVSKVSWYLGNTKKSSLRYSQSTPSVGALYQYNWKISNLRRGHYHWIAVVYDTSGDSQLVTNNNGKAYDDMLVGY